MLRSFFIMLSKVKWAQKLIMGMGFARKMATRFVAGDKLSDAIEAIKGLNKIGIFATLDHLGENTTNETEASKATQDVIEMVDAIDQSGIQSNISIKLSQIGYTLGIDLCTRNLKAILEYAQQKGIFVRIDMEDSTTTEETIRLCLEMRQSGFNRVGIVIQSYLYRSEDDIRKLCQSATPVRLCKGAYKEPEIVAFPKKSDVDENYDKLTSLLMDGEKSIGSPGGSDNGRTPPISAIATHDEKRVDYAKSYADKIELSREAFEFQMLYGIRRDLQETLVKEGYHVRTYVPFGTQWYPYYMRRLAERPANLWFMVSNLFR